MRRAAVSRAQPAMGEPPATTPVAARRRRRAREEARPETPPPTLRRRTPGAWPRESGASEQNPQQHGGYAGHDAAEPVPQALRAERVAAEHVRLVGEGRERR